jgi:hypothetical protein
MGRLPAAVITGLALLTCSCSGSGIGGLEQIQDLPLELAEGISPPGWVLFQDDFSDPGSGWEVSEDVSGRREYLDGTFRFSITRPDWSYWSTPGLSFSDVHIDAQITRSGGDGLSSAGVICRYQDEQNFYFFSITSDGYFGISKVEDGRETLIGQNALSSSGNILRGNATNFIGADCIGDQLTLWINGIESLEVHHAGIPRGDAGIIASLLDGRAAALEFDNFSVLKP